MIEKVKSQQDLEVSETQGDREWLEANLSELDESEPYDWGNLDPLTLGKPVRYFPERGFVVEGGKERVRASRN
ncbi:MAG: hypothetical protein AAGA60_11690 [Cyanobacteria bacterium P01_E01_bin.42]